MAETVGTAFGQWPEVFGFETARKGIDMVNNAKTAVDTLHNQGRAFSAGGIPPAQIKPKYDCSDVYSLNSLLKVSIFFSFYYIIFK